VYNEPLADTTLIGCPHCDLLQRLPELAPGASARCPRCDKELWRRREDSLNRTLALTLGAALCLIFTTWRSGRLELRAALAKMAVPRSELAKLVAGVQRVPGTGVFLASNANLVPSALIRNIEHNCVLHQRVIILNVEIADTPRQDPVRRLRIEEPLPGVHWITARFGFMETPDVAEALKACRARGLRVFTEDSSFFVGRHVVRARPLPGLRGLQRRLFARMQQYSTQAAEFFRMPFRDVVILNTAVEI